MIRQLLQGCFLVVGLMSTAAAAQGGAINQGDIGRTSQGLNTVAYVCFVAPGHAEFVHDVRRCINRNQPNFFLRRCHNSLNPGPGQNATSSFMEGGYWCQNSGVYDYFYCPAPGAGPWFVGGGNLCGVPLPEVECDDGTIVADANQCRFYGGHIWNSYYCGDDLGFLVGTRQYRASIGERNQLCGYP